MKDADLTKTQVDVLSVLADEPRSGPQVQSALEAQYGSDMSRQWVHENLGELGAMGLVDRKEYEVDGRTHEFYLTDEGQGTIERYVGLLEERLSRVPAHYR